MANLQPNRYVMQSSDGVIKVDYETTSFIGQPTFNLTEGSGPTKHFAGSQIRTVATEVGTLVTVTTRLTIDTGSTSLTVLIPAISLSGIADHQTFATEAIVTNHTGPNSFPFTGVHETYGFIPLNGTASFVLTLFQLVQEGVAKMAKP